MSNAGEVGEGEVADLPNLQQIKIERDYELDFLEVEIPECYVLIEPLKFRIQLAEPTDFNTTSTQHDESTFRSPKSINNKPKPIAIVNESPLRPKRKSALKAKYTWRKIKPERVYMADKQEQDEEREDYTVPSPNDHDWTHHDDNDNCIAGEIACAASDDDGDAAEEHQIPAKTPNRRKIKSTLLSRSVSLSVDPAPLLEAKPAAPKSLKAKARSRTASTPIPELKQKKGKSKEKPEHRKPESEEEFGKVKPKKKRVYISQSTRPKMIKSADGRLEYMGISIDIVEIDGIVKYKCTLCTSTQRDIVNVRRHVRETHPDGQTDKKFVCSKCGKVLTNPHSFQRHHSIYHSDKPRVLYDCSICGKSLSSLRGLRNHGSSTHGVLSGAKYFFCEVCARPFQENRSLKFHRVSHMNEQEKQELLATDPKAHKYILYCQYCNKTCTSEASLRVHENVHTGARPFVCDVCGRPCRTRQSLNEHVKVRHGGPREFPYECDYPDCGAMFARRRQLYGHSFSHYPDQERPCKCVHCNASYIFSAELKRHLLTHKGGSEQRPFACSICGKTFGRSAHVKRHHRRVHKIDESIPVLKNAAEAESDLLKNASETESDLPEESKPELPEAEAAETEPEETELKPYKSFVLVEELIE